MQVIRRAAHIHREAAHCPEVGRFEPVGIADVRDLLEPAPRERELSSPPLN